MALIVRNAEILLLLAIPEITNAAPKMLPTRIATKISDISSLCIKNYPRMVITNRIKHPTSTAVEMAFPCCVKTPSSNTKSLMGMNCLMVEVMNPASMNDMTATIDLGDNRGRPHTPKSLNKIKIRIPCPLVHPLLSFVPKPTKKPPIEKSMAPEF